MKWISDFGFRISDFVETPERQSLCESHRQRRWFHESNEPMAKRLTLILGGARSGKSAHAEWLASERGGAVLYVATAVAGDDEMRVRIAEHRSRRRAEWTTLEAPRDVGAAIDAHGGDFDVVLVDCLTLLVSNVILALPGVDSGGAQSSQEAGAVLDREIDALLACSRGTSAEWILVSNEVGLGLVPPNPLGRLYRDALGRVNHRLAAAADEVLFMVAGLPMKVK